MPENKFLSTCIYLLLSVLSQVDPSWAQQRVFSVHGELQSDSHLLRLADFQVELVSQSAHMTTDRAHVASDGSFLLHGVSPGSTHVRVVDLHGEILQDEFVTIQDGVPLTINLRLPEQSHAATGKISARELAHPVPEKAVREYARAKKAAAEGDLDKTVAHFSKAVGIHPQFFQAWNDLGVAFVKAKHLSEAAEAFQKAADIAPENQVVQTNLKVTLHHLHLAQRQAAVPTGSPQP